MKKLRLLCLLTGVMFMAGCQTNGAHSMCTVKFDTNTTLNASSVSTQTVKKGSRVKTPASTILGSNPENYNVYGWYREKSLTNQWNFKKDTVTKSMTLYAKWERKFTVNYYTMDSKYPINTISVFEGTTVKEHTEYCAGFEYLGSFSDPDFTVPFDYNTPITQDTDIYMKRSEGISIYEGNPTGGIFDNLEINGPTDNSGEVGNLTKVTDEFGEEAVLIDFGYSPKLADPFVELSLNLDITKSQIIHFVMKHYGKGNVLSLYFTTLLDLNDYTYSATGKNYGPNFRAEYIYKPEEIEMTEEDDYIDVAIDLANASLFHGYSVWGTSSYLGKLRIQSSWQSTSATDRSNKILLKKIYGSNEGYEGGIETTDSSIIAAKCQDESNLPSQDELPNGFVFPKNNEYVTTGDTAQAYKRKDGLLVHFENEIAMRSHTDKTQSFAITLPSNDDGDVIGDKIISLDTYKTVYFRLKNLGYVENLKVVIKNDWEGSVFTNIKLPTRMNDFKLFSVNLTSDSSMRKNLLSIQFEYTSSGVDNALLFDRIYFEEAKPYDIAGISFDDKNVFGLSGANVAISYNPSYRSTEFNVKSSGAVVTSKKTDIKMTNRGFYYAELVYTRPNNSTVDEVRVSFYNGSSYVNELSFTLEGREKSSTVKVPIGTQTGNFSNIKIKFIGLGVVRINALKFTIDDTYCLDMSNDFTGCYDSTWYSGINYAYDEMTSASSLEVNTATDINSRRWSMYLGYGHRYYSAYNCQNLPCLGKNKIVIVYHNSGETASCNFTASFSNALDDNPDAFAMHKVFNNVTFNGNMKDYEWSHVELAIPEEYMMKYLGKINFGGLTNSITVRVISVI